MSELLDSGLEVTTLLDLICRWHYGVPLPPVPSMSSSIGWCDEQLSNRPLG
jgi:hypothetical protein